MIKFRNLFLKEIKELITKQFVISLLMTLVIFYFVSQMAKIETKKTKATVSIMDLDQSALSRGLANTLKTAKFPIELINGNDVETAVQEAMKGDTSLLLVIPQGFGTSVDRLEPKEVTTYAFLRSFSIGGMEKSGVLKIAIGTMNAYLSNDVLKKKVPGVSPEVLENPLKSKDYVLVKDKRAEGSASAITGFVYSQSIAVPIILFLIILYSSQMVISAIAMEKQNKTLETLLTVPIPRTYIVATKMLAAGIVGLLAAIIFMGGMRSLMGGFTQGASSGASMGNVIKELGLTLSGNGYMLLGVSIFFALLCGLAIATILGVLAEDFRSAQSLLLPITLMILIPYMLSFVADINSLPLPAKLLIMAIPFSHPFLATQNIMLGRYAVVQYGILYMAVVFFILVALAARIFSTDRVLTMKLSWKKKPVVL